MANAQPKDTVEEKENFVDELKPGTQLMHGQYTIESFLNAGGFGITYLARDSLDRKVVIKECFPGAFCRRSRAVVQARSRAHQAELKSIVRLFVQEARSLAKLDHPNIVGVHQVFEDNDTAYMALDFVRGRDLLDIIEDSSASLTPAQTKNILKEVLAAVGFIHDQQILHRDISPDNILINKDYHPVLIDFGAAREEATKQSRVLSALRVVKDGYSPQEFYIAGSDQSPSSDLYALAASFHHLIVGDVPPNSQARLAAIASGETDPYEPIVGRFKDYDDNFLAAIDKALAVLPKDRVQTAQEWLNMMEGIDGGNVTALNVGGGAAAGDAGAAAPAAAKKSNMPLLLGSAAAVALLVGVGVMTMSGGEDAPVAQAPAAAPATETAAETPAAPAVEEATAAVETPAIVEESVAAESAAPVEEAPVAEETAAVDETPAFLAPETTIVEEAAPVVEEAAPAAEEATAAVEEVAPIVEETTAAVEEVAPVVEETTAAVEEAAPAAEDTTAVEEAAIIAALEDAVTTGIAPAADAATETAATEAPVIVEEAAPIETVATPAITVDPALIETATDTSTVVAGPVIEDAPTPSVRPLARPEAVELAAVPAPVPLPEPVVTPVLTSVDPVANDLPQLASTAPAQDALTPEVTLPVAPEQVSAIGEGPVVDILAVTPGNEIIPEPVGPTSADVDTFWSVRLPFTPAGEESNIIAQAAAISPVWVQPGIVITAVNGTPVQTINDIPDILRATTPESALAASMPVLFGTADPSTNTIATQPWVLPVVQNVTLADGTAFETSFAGSEWRTVVAELPTPEAGGLQVGDVVSSYIATSEAINDRTSIYDIFARELGNGVEQYTFAVQRDGSLWIASYTYGGAEE